MARRDEAQQYLLNGHSPSEIADMMQLSFSTVEQYLFHRVGVGEFRRSDILYSIPKEIRNAIEKEYQLNKKLQPYEIADKLKSSFGNISNEEVKLYFRLRNVRILMGDLYETITEIESLLHKFIKIILQIELGLENWWRKGIPEVIRVKCAESLERDPNPRDHRYAYTTLIQLKDIFSKKWSIFLKYLPEHITCDKSNFLSKLTRLNNIRNIVMHPNTGIKPTEEDFLFVKTFAHYLDFKSWLDLEELKSQ